MKVLQGILEWTVLAALGVASAVYSTDLSEWLGLDPNVAGPIITMVLITFVIVADRLYCAWKRSRAQKRRWKEIDAEQVRRWHRIRGVEVDGKPVDYTLIEGGGIKITSGIPEGAAVTVVYDTDVEE